MTNQRFVIDLVDATFGGGESLCPPDPPPGKPTIIAQRTVLP